MIKMKDKAQHPDEGSASVATCMLSTCVAGLYPPQEYV